LSGEVAVARASSAVEAVIFDLDGVLIDSEQVWDEVRRSYVTEAGGRWHASAQRDMMGMSSTEWSRYVREQLGVERPAERISEEVARRVELSYRKRLPLLPGARQAVERLAALWPLALASSSNRELIDLVLELAGLGHCFEATVSSEETAHGKPAPDVYLEAARRLGVEPSRCVAVEDSHNGILSAHSAGMGVVAVPNQAFRPGEEALATTAAVLASLDELSPEQVESAAS
jgi:HAD superfamily hydrolase (TIGR01509 family)